MIRKSRRKTVSLVGSCIPLARACFQWLREIPINPTSWYQHPKRQANASVFGHIQHLNFSPYSFYCSSWLLNIKLPLVTILWELSHLRLCKQPGRWKLLDKSRQQALCVGEGGFRLRCRALSASTGWLASTLAGQHFPKSTLHFLHQVSFLIILIFMKLQVTFTQWFLFGDQHVLFS